MFYAILSELQSYDWFSWSVYTMKQKGSFRSSVLFYDYRIRSIDNIIPDLVSMIDNS